MVVMRTGRENSAWSTSVSDQRDWQEVQSGGKLFRQSSTPRNSSSRTKRGQRHNLEIDPSPFYFTGNGKPVFGSACLGLLKSLDEILIES